MHRREIPKNRKIRPVWILLGWLLVWEGISRLAGSEILMVGPVKTAQTLVRLVAQKEFWLAAGNSLGHIGLGFLLGLSLAVLLAAWSAKRSLVEEILSPLILLMKSMPIASFVVLFLIWWRSSVLSVTVSFLVVFPVVYVNTLEGIRSTDEKLLEMAQVFGMSWKNRLFYLYRPAMRSFLDSAVKTSVGMCWKAGVAAEVIGIPDHTLGEKLYVSKIYLDTAGVLAWTVSIILLSLICEKLVLFLWHGFLKWEPVCSRSPRTYRKKGIWEEIPAVLKNVDKSYGEHKVLEKFSASYEAGQTYYLNSPSGSGKTTLLRLLAGLEQADSGEIKCDTEKIAMVFQEDRLAEEYSALKNVELVTGDVQKAAEHLKQLFPTEQLSAKLCSMPCSALSGGMKRRVALARAVAADREVLLLDEPFTGLDKENVDKAKAYIQKYAREKAVLIATHID